MSLQNLAQNLATHGRGEDTVLVHMTPGEVNGLQSLAMAHGGSLSINPTTGLPEAGFLRRILPSVIGTAVGVATGNPMLGAAVAGGLGYATTDSLMGGLTAAAGAYGGANLAGSAANLAAPAATAAAPAAAVPAVTSPLIGASAASLPTAASSLTAPLGSFGNIGAANLGTAAIPELGTVAVAPGAVGAGGYGSLMAGPTATAATNPMTIGTIGEGFGNAFSSPAAAGNFLGANKMNLAMTSAPFLFGGEPAGAGSVANPMMIRPFQYTATNTSGQDPYSIGDTRERTQISGSYTALEPYRASEAYKRKQPFAAAQGGIVAFQEGGDVGDSGGLAGLPISSEAARTMQNIAMVQGLAGLPASSFQNFSNFTPRQAPVGFAPRSLPSTKATLYNVQLPKAETSETYNSIKDKDSLDALREQYQAFLDPNYGGGGAKAGGMMPNDLKFAQGRFLQGPGDGTSDSIPATIADKQPARLADGEFVIDARTVSEIGNGSSKAGAKKLYAMMDRVHSARKKATRGKDSKADRFMPA